MSHEPLDALASAENWIRTREHGDNCFLTDDPPEFNTCRCGRDDVLRFIESVSVDASVKREQEACSYCGEFYPKPVSLHHTTEECHANEARNASPSNGRIPKNPDLAGRPNPMPSHEGVGTGREGTTDSAPVVPRPEITEAFLFGMETALENDMDIDKLVDRFLAWPLPENVCADSCASIPGYPHRSGTNLLTADQARTMIEYLLADSAPKMARPMPTEVETLRVVNDNMRRCLQWYADGNHFTLEDWEAPEGGNEGCWLCPPSEVEGIAPFDPGDPVDISKRARHKIDLDAPWMVEDGTVARLVLAGGQMNTDPADEETIVHAVEQPKVARP